MEHGCHLVVEFATYLRKEVGGDGVHAVLQLVVQHCSLRVTCREEEEEYSSESLYCPFRTFSGAHSRVFQSRLQTHCVKHLHHNSLMNQLMLCCYSDVFDELISELVNLQKEPKKMISMTWKFKLYETIHEWSLLVFQPLYWFDFYLICLKQAQVKQPIRPTDKQKKIWSWKQKKQKRNI